VLALPILLLPLGCRPLPEPTLVMAAGTYVADGDWSVDVLELRPDGGFEERWISYDGTVTRTPGQWRIEERRGAWFIVLDLAYLGNPARQSDPTRRMWALEYVRNQLGCARLVLLPDDAALFVQHASHPSGSDRP